jgi:uncharacterized membrane protein HdeD (DUF308 family)
MAGQRKQKEQSKTRTIYAETQGLEEQQRLEEKRQRMSLLLRNILVFILYMIVGALFFLLAMFLIKKFENNPEDTGFFYSLLILIGFFGALWFVLWPIVVLIAGLIHPKERTSDWWDWIHRKKTM